MREASVNPFPGAALTAGASSLLAYRPQSGYPYFSSIKHRLVPFAMFYPASKSGFDAENTSAHAHAHQRHEIVDATGQATCALISGLGAVTFRYS
jgi:hypothetical protein